MIDLEKRVKELEQKVTLIEQVIGRPRKLGPQDNYPNQDSDDTFEKICKQIELLSRNLREQSNEMKKI